MAVDLWTVYGSLIGAAIGDALGAPVEGWHVADIRRTHGKVTRFLPQPSAAERPEGVRPVKSLTTACCGTTCAWR